MIPQGLLYILNQNGLTLGGGIIASLAILSGTLLLIGYLTPVAASVASLNSLTLWLVSRFAIHQIGPLNLIAFEIIIPVAIAFLGPGAFSVDARLFGHREIIIPRSSDRLTQ